MATLSMPADGLLLLRTPEQSPPSHPALSLQVMRLNLAQKVTEEILKSFQNKEKVSIRFGNRVTVQHGKKLYPVFSYPESIPSELYQRSGNDHDAFYFSGKLSHRLETKRAQTDVAKSNEALANLENTLKCFEEQKVSNEARFVTDRDELRQLTEASQKGKGYSTQPSAIRKDRLLNINNRSDPSSPFLGASRSPGMSATSATRLTVPSISKDQLRLNAIKIPFLHLLAVKPLTTGELVETLHATKQDCAKLLHKYIKDIQEANGIQELKDKAYRELDLWKFPYPTDDDRQTAIDRAISAFDRMRISTSDQIWETLLPTKERGKGKGSELSRLKIGQGGLIGAGPKKGLTKRASQSPTDTETDNGKPLGKAKNPTVKARPRSGTDDGLEKNSAARKEAMKPVKEARNKDVTKRERKKAPSNGKFKSSEVIEDSDEELAGSKSSIERTKKSNTTTKSSISNPKPKSTATVPSQKPAMVSSSAPSKTVGGLMPTAALSRPRSESTTIKASPRHRTDSSPQKPSPLASSPPTNATDLENSQSSKPNSLSSATSSPRITPPQGRGQKATAAAKMTAEPKTQSSALKRKASDVASPAPKRQQQPNGAHVARPTLNGTTKSQTQQRQSNTNKTSSSSSQRSRTPSSSISTTSSSSSVAPQSDLQLKSRKFKIQYARYQDLHAKIMALPESDRDVEEVAVLRRMHGRIGELKKEIWEGWRRESRGVGTGNGLAKSVRNMK